MMTALTNNSLDTVRLMVEAGVNTPSTALPFDNSASGDTSPDRIGGGVSAVYIDPDGRENGMAEAIRFDEMMVRKVE